MKLAKIVKHCRIDKPSKFKLADFDPARRTRPHYRLEISRLWAAAALAGSVPPSDLLLRSPQGAALAPVASSDRKTNTGCTKQAKNQGDFSDPLTSNCQHHVGKIASRILCFRKTLPRLSLTLVP
jgi:hypothetical protein